VKGTCDTLSDASLVTKLCGWVHSAVIYDTHMLLVVWLHINSTRKHNQFLV